MIFNSEKCFTINKCLCIAWQISSVLQRRGQMKEQQFMRKLQQQMDEEEKLRIPIAQRLPLTTDEPQVSFKSKQDILCINDDHCFHVLSTICHPKFHYILKCLLPNLQVLPKPPVKEKTKRLNVKLHTESRAAERAEFDQFVCLNPIPKWFLHFSLESKVHLHSNKNHLCS